LQWRVVYRICSAVIEVMDYLLEPPELDVWKWAVVDLLAALSVEVSSLTIDPWCYVTI
jgi:hypothetical protein